MPKQIFIFLDANFLLVPAQLKLDIYAEFDLLVPHSYSIVILEAILRELELKAARLGPQSTFSREFRLAQQLLERHDYHVIHGEPTPQLSENLPVDDFLIREVRQFTPPSQGGIVSSSQEGVDHPSQVISSDMFQVYIATNDKQLKKKARFEGIPVIYIRQKRFLDVDI
ncbi:MAG: type II toxin-antitoxin system VapC family toxin [Promethearchaeota archaeon]